MLPITDNLIDVTAVPVVWAADVPLGHSGTAPWKYQSSYLFSSTIMFQMQLNFSDTGVDGNLACTELNLEDGEWVAVGSTAKMLGFGHGGHLELLSRPMAVATITSIPNAGLCRIRATA
ncbi:MAG TPA: hypothetical protein VHV79_05485 [Mycobacteriales bacterium]|nr:hypothetical protein [Mycobacteriales bacterium]